MATKIVMEALSPTMEEGRLVRWTKHEGDAVKQGDVLAEVETDKAVMELVARGDGVLRKRIAGEGEAAPVGSLLGVIAASDENIEAIVGGAAAAPVSAPLPPEEQRAPEPPAQIVARITESAGITSIPTAPGMSQGEASTPPQERERRGHMRINSASTVSAQSAQPSPNGRMRASPLARRLASERGVELTALQGSGPGGRIVKRDIEQATSQPEASRPAAATPAAKSTVPHTQRAGDFVDVPLTQIRKTIAKRLAESIGPVPTFYLTAEYDVTRMAELRASLAESNADHKVSFNDILVKTLATALVRHPEVNAHWMGDRIRQFYRVHIGMAVAIEEGLITPVIFDADQKGLGEISRESKELAARARERKLTPEQYTGSTFSISNLGMLGIDHFTAIINPPESAILAVGAVTEQPVVLSGEVAIRKRLRVTMSCDHRVIDGATGARFLQTVRGMLENPLLLVY